jgi:hypothetical protein
VGQGGGTTKVAAAGTGGSSGAAGIDAGPPARPRPTKLDVLFMIDNSISMSDKQDILRRVAPDLMSRLVNPICLDEAGNEFPAPLPGTDCPQGQRRQFAPLADVHVGVVSSSLGDFGSNVACPGLGFPRYVPDRNDQAHLMGSLARSSAPGNAQGFLEWRAGTTELDTFDLQFQRMLTDVGESGCGWESSLESWYRFLVDPRPYRELARVACPGSASPAANCVAPATDANGEMLLDDTLLAQRAAFLRDDSMVAIVLLSDENDCSAQVGGQSWVVFNLEDTRPMTRGSSICATDPNDKCCYACPLAPPAGCAADPACTADPTNPNRLSSAEDGQNLRCYDQKRRFGQDFLYPTARYVNALTRPQLCRSALDLSTAGCDAADLVDNPLFKGGRVPAEVFLSGIVGVPWQTIASTEDAYGRAIDPSEVLRFKSYGELTTGGVWDQILGSPGVPWRAATASQPEVSGSPGTLPTLPQMVESPQFPRPGVDVGNALNGRDYDTAQGANQGGGTPRADDLQYACIFPLPAPRDCGLLDPNNDNCNCYESDNDRPLCEQTPGVTPPGLVEYWAKAYPGSRQLQVLKDFGAQTSNSVVASICARNTTDASRSDYGYRPAMAAIIERLQAASGGP